MPERKKSAMAGGRAVFGGAIVCSLALVAGGCQSLDKYAVNRNRKPRPATVSPSSDGRPPAVVAGDEPARAASDGRRTAGAGADAPAPGRAAPGQQYVERAQRLQTQGNLEEALREFEKAIEVNPTLTVAYLGAGDIHRQMGDYAGAERRYARAAELEPTNFSAQYLHALSLQLLDRTGEAIRAYLRALTIRPEDFDANMNLGIAYLQVGEPAEGLAYLQRAVRTNPRNAAARTNLGAIYSALDRHEEAVVEYQQAAELTELTGPVLLNLANSLGRSGRYEEMVNTLEQLTRTEPTPNAYERLGAGLFRLRRYEEALASYRKALEIDPNHFPALNGVGVCLMNEWHFTDQKDERARREALDAWRRSLQIQRNQPRILELLGKYQ
ncbi:MAG: tetratricopeptide repeat protein [Planctomycetota bacterium]|nr:tetratricopeptide repeat protein [Planctomycetota bacterium]